MTNREAVFTPADHAKLDASLASGLDFYTSDYLDYGVVVIPVLGKVVMRDTTLITMLSDGVYDELDRLEKHFLDKAGRRFARALWEMV